MPARLQVSDPVGALSNTGNMILSRMPLQNATSMVYKSTAGWQSFVSNGVLHATTRMPDGVLLHLFTTHLQCTTAPPTKTVIAPQSLYRSLHSTTRQQQQKELSIHQKSTLNINKNMWRFIEDCGQVAFHYIKATKGTGTRKH